MTTVLTMTRKELQMIRYELIKHRYAPSCQQDMTDRILSKTNKTDHFSLTSGQAKFIAETVP